MITYLKKPLLNHPQLLIGWPGMGYVASRTVSYLVEALGCERFAFIEPFDYFFPTSVVVEDSEAAIPPLPGSNFYYWKNPFSGSDLIFFQGDSQPAPSLQMKMAREVLGLASGMDVFRLWTFAAAPAAIQHKDDPRVWGVVNRSSLKEYLSSQGIEMLGSGQISGLNGLLLGVAGEFQLPGICLLGEIPYYTVNLENPRAVRSILQHLRSLLYLDIDFLSLEDDVQDFDREITRIGKKAQETMASFIQEDNEEDFGLDRYEPDTEEEAGGVIPSAARKRIEELFKMVKEDPVQAPLLKAELDRWGVYPIYEDRFLDLFRDGSAG